MQLQYGAYQWAINGCDITSEVDILWNQGGQPYALKKTFHIKGRLGPTSGQADTTNQQNAFMNAMSLPYKDLILLQDSGAKSADVLLNAGSISGVQPVKFSFPEGNGAEYAVYRTFAVSFWAEYPLPNTQSLLLSFRETLSFSGGLPLFSTVPTINGPPVRQMIYAQTPFTAAQEGEMIGYRQRPTAPPPLWPDALKQSPTLKLTAPKRRGAQNVGGYDSFGLAYAYQFESPTPLVGVPNVWIS